MGQSTENLHKLLLFIKDLIAEPGNEDFKTSLSHLLISNTQSSLDNEKIDSIYELCIEKIAREEASAFYKDFPIESIKSQLIEDYVKMEHWKRRANFDEFSLALYQQYELIINTISRSQNLDAAFSKLLAYHAYTDGKSYDRVCKGAEFILARLIFPYDKRIEGQYSLLETQNATEKYKAILYMIVYGGRMKSDEYQKFVEQSRLFYDLYQMRCKNHRGGTITQNQQEIYERVRPNCQLYYMKMLGEFAFFIERVKLNLAQTANLIAYANHLPDKKIIVPLAISDTGRRIKLSNEDSNRFEHK